jgi:uncharacterized protein (TIGR02391 family)
MRPQRTANVLATAKLIQAEVNSAGLGPIGNATGSPYDILITEVPIIQASRQLFTDGHYSQAVEQAFKCVNNVVKDRSGSPDDGAKLMRGAFSANQPILMLNSLRTQSEKDEQQGYMDIMAGSMTGIRNPRAHEHQRVDAQSETLEMLVLANHLARIARVARRKRTRRQHNVST